MLHSFFASQVRDWLSLQGRSPQSHSVGSWRLGRTSEIPKSTPPCPQTTSLGATSPCSLSAPGDGDSSTSLAASFCPVAVVGCSSGHTSGCRSMCWVIFCGNCGPGAVELTRPLETFVPMQFVLRVATCSQSHQCRICARAWWCKARALPEDPQNGICSALGSKLLSQSGGP